MKCKAVNINKSFKSTRFVVSLTQERRQNRIPTDEMENNCVYCKLVLLEFISVSAKKNV